MKRSPRTLISKIETDRLGVLLEIIKSKRPVATFECFENQIRQRSSPEPAAFDVILIRMSQDEFRKLAAETLLLLEKQRFNTRLSLI